MAKLHVLARKEDLLEERLAGKAVVVVDVLFATSSIVTALAHGATEVIPTLDGEAALAAAAGRPAGSYVLAGELDAVTLPGFAHPTPLSLLERGLAGKTLVYSTTNGTVALARSRGAEAVYAGALLNGEALARRLVETSRGETVLVVCAGSGGGFNLEDFYAAGHLVSLLVRTGAYAPTDAALAARLLHDRTDALECLSAGRVGRMMRERGLEAEVAYAARKGRYETVPVLRDGRLTA